MFKITPWQAGISWSLRRFSGSLRCQYYDEGNLTLAQFLGNLEWVKTLPEEVLIAARAFEKAYHKHTMASLWLVSRNQYALERFLHEPLLFFLSVHYGVTHQVPAEQLFELYTQKRERVFEWYQLPVEKRLIKFFKRFFSQYFEEARFKQIISLIQKYGVDRVLTIKNIHRAFLNTLEANPELLDCPAFLNVQQVEGIKPILMLIVDIKRMSSSLNESASKKLKKCKTHAQLQNLHVNLIEKTHRALQEECDANIFPTPPKLPSHPDIQHINHLPALIQEGEQMEHCVASYAEEILAQKYYVFKVFKPQRATLSLKRERGKLVIHQLYLKKNKEPSQQTIDAVERWLEYQPQGL